MSRMGVEGYGRRSGLPLSGGGQMETEMKRNRDEHERIDESDIGK